VPSDDFEELWRDHFRSVTRTAYLITGDAQEAHDCAQEAFVRALQRWSKVGSMEKPEGWVHRVATNLAISSARRRRFPWTIETPTAVPAPEPPDDGLRRALLRLTPAQRAVIALRFYLDWSVQDVADALGKAPGTVRALTHQAMQRLRESAPQETTDE
jgi:RNA polymerase sigma-70 factor (sigma-E family)